MQLFISLLLRLVLAFFQLVIINNFVDGVIFRVFAPKISRQQYFAVFHWYFLFNWFSCLAGRTSES